MLYFEDLSAAAGGWRAHADPKGLYDYAGSQGSRIYLRTTDGAPKAASLPSILAGPAASIGRKWWRDAGQPRPRGSRQRRLLLSYLHNAHARPLYSLETKTPARSPSMA